MSMLNSQARLQDKPCRIRPCLHPTMVLDNQWRSVRQGEIWEGRNLAVVERKNLLDAECGAGMFPRVFEHKAFLSSMKGVTLKWREPLKMHTTFKVGGPVACLAMPGSTATLERLVTGLSRREVPWVVLGGGSNVLVLDDPWDVVVIRLESACSQIDMPDLAREREGRRVSVHVGAGVSLPSFLRFCVQKQLGGAEFLVGIPGTMGGAIFMNAGALGGVLSDILQWVEVLSPRGQKGILAKNVLPCAYRSMGIPNGHVLLGARLSLEPKEMRRIKEDLRRLVVQRKRTQPVGAASAGCVFKNPEGHSAGALIDEAELKGMRLGGAEISKKHANWIINTGSATARDILRLMEHVEQVVLDRFGVSLEREVRVWGAWGD